MSAPRLTLRTTSPGLLGLPWEQPLRDWDPATVPLRELPVGPSRHLVRFVEVDGTWWALKELPERLARREYAVLRHLEDTGLPAVRAAGLVEYPGTVDDPSRRSPIGVLPSRPDHPSRRSARPDHPSRRSARPDHPSRRSARPDDDSAILVTRYLTGSWQYRRLIMRLPPDRAAHRARLFDAMVGLLVELHRHGVYWGDCSLANSLFSRDGQHFAAHLVDAETSEVHPALSDGQRTQDLEILVENVAAGMLDLAAMLDRPPDIEPKLIAEATALPERYEALWSVLHAEPQFAFGDRYRVESTVRELNDLGFVVDEVGLTPVDPGEHAESGEHAGREVRLRTGVGDRRHHARRLEEMTGLDVGEGQARVLLGDLRAHQERIAAACGRRVSASEAVPSWVHDVFTPGSRRAHAAVGHKGTAVQAYCDLLEVRWLLSEEAGADVGTDAGLAALADRAPVDSAARALVADTASDLPRIDPEPPGGR